MAKEQMVIVCYPFWDMKLAKKAKELLDAIGYIGFIAIEDVKKE